MWHTVLLAFFSHSVAFEVSEPNEVCSPGLVELLPPPAPNAAAGKAGAVGPEAELLGLDLLSVPVVLVVLAADIPPAPHGVGAWEGEGAGGGLLEGGLLGGGIPWATRVDEPRERETDELTSLERPRR